MKPFVQNATVNPDISLFGGKKAVEAKNNPFYLPLLAFERSVWYQLIQINSSLQIIVVFFLSFARQS